MNSTSWIMVTCPCVINLSLWWDFTVFLTTVTDSSLALWMTPYQFSSPRVQILHIRFGWRLTFPLLWRLTLPSLWRLFSNCHSERGQACLVGKTENGTMNRSEESITLMTSYRLPHYGSRSFTFASDDALLSVITQNGGRKRIFILFFCVIPPSQYPPSGFAGHLLINKEACPIPIFPVRIPFLNTAANLLLALRVTPDRPPSFSTFSWQLPTNG